MSGYFGCMPIAITTCFLGRLKIMLTKAISEQVCGGRCIYGDTDSVFLLFSHLDTVDALQAACQGMSESEKVVIFCEAVCKLITGELPPPMDLAFEKTMGPFLMIQKKGYSGVYMYPDEKRGKFIFKGTSNVRRDSCQLARDTVESCLMAALFRPAEFEAPPKVGGRKEAPEAKRAREAAGAAWRAAAMAAMFRPGGPDAPPEPGESEDATRARLAARDSWRAAILAPLSETLDVITAVDPETDRPTVPLSMLQRTVAKAAAYSTDKMMQVTVIKELEKRRGTPIDVGTRIPFVIVLPPHRGRSKKDKLYKYAEEVTYVRDNDIPVDRGYYLGRQLLNPLCRYLGGVMPVARVRALVEPAMRRVVAQDERLVDVHHYFARRPDEPDATGIGDAEPAQPNELMDPAAEGVDVEQPVEMEIDRDNLGEVAAAV